MAFAIFYNDVDMAELVEKLQNEPKAAPYLEAGIADWASCPLGQSPYEEPIPTNTARVIVCTYGTLAEFIDIVYSVGLAHLADDMGRECGGVEGWS